MFEYCKFSGTPYQIGFQHGTQRKTQIHQAIKIYTSTFTLSDQEIDRRLEIIRKTLQEHFPRFHEEMQGIADGAECDLRSIYMLNARSELIDSDSAINNKKIQNDLNECTVINAPEEGLICQNRDFLKELEPLICLGEITLANGTRILQIMEPGIIGKIGFNSHGIGVTLNFLEGERGDFGVPIHCMLRLLLEQASFEDAYTLAHTYATGKTGSISLMDGHGNHVNFEFYGGTVYDTGAGKKPFTRTNHYLNTQILEQDSSLEEKYADKKYASSQKRYEVAQKIAQQTPLTKEYIKAGLLDKSEGKLSICRAYPTDPNAPQTGTITSILMDLPKREMMLTLGNPFDNDFTTYRV